GHSANGTPAGPPPLRYMKTTQRRASSALKGVNIRRRSGVTIGCRLTEFIHKSFGEYLAARGLISAAYRSAKQLADDDNDKDEADIAEDWARLIQNAEFTKVTEQVITFLYDEARRRPDAGVQAEMQKVFTWVQTHGAPVHKVSTEPSYRELETQQRCTEAAILGVTSALASANFENAETDEARQDVPRVAFRPGTEEKSLNRLHTTLAHANRRLLKMAYLSGADLSRANLRGAYLSGAILHSTDLTRSVVTGARVRSVDLSEAIGLTDDHVNRCFGVKSGYGKSDLPSDLTYPDHWHAADDADEDSFELYQAFDEAYRKWRATL
ncbi:MAG: pentapeptide repeat-containing protein, partial [Pseudomonadota bacterium]